MAELLIRASSQDGALLRKIYGVDGGSGAPARPDRVVVDAHTPAGRTDIMSTARRAGIPLLIDPQTYYLHGLQHPNDPWATLPFGHPSVWTSFEASCPEAQEDLVARVIDYQVSGGATAIIPAYVYIDRLNSEWAMVQAALWRRTRDYLDRNEIALPVTAVLAIGWRVLHPVQGAATLDSALRALSELKPKEVALMASNIAAGAHPQERLMDLVLMVARLRCDYPVILWQQGHLGDVGVAAGATGYECGIGWREACNINAAMNRRRHLQQSGPRQPRPVYVPALGRSVPKRSLQAISHHRDIWRQLICPEPDCCPPGGRGLLGDARMHAVVQRARQLDQIARIDMQAWRWQRLAEMADAGLALAQSINRHAPTNPLITQVDCRALSAISAVSHARRQDSRTAHVA